MKAFLIDDEPIAIDRLRVLIQEQCNCSGADNANYTCACGAKLVPVSG